MQGKMHDRVVEMRLCFFSGKVGDYKVLFKSTRKCRSTTQTVVKKEYETQMQKNQGLSMIACGLTGVFVAGAFLFYIEKQRKKKQRRGRKHETDDNRYGYEDQFL